MGWFFIILGIAIFAINWRVRKNMPGRAMVVPILMCGATIAAGLYIITN